MVRPARLIAVVEALLFGRVILLVVVGCAGVRSEAPQREEQEHTETTRQEQEITEATEATASEDARCDRTRTIDLLKVGVVDSSVKPEDPEARFVTNDVPGCPNKGGLLSGTDKGDQLAGEDGEDEVRGLGASDHLSGGRGSDVVYGGPGNDELQAGGWHPGLASYTDRSNNVLYGGAGRDLLDGQAGDDVLYGGDDVIYGGNGNDSLGSSYDGGHRDKLYCGKGWDEARPDKSDYVSSSCEVKR